jgi:hypothetical protein
MFHSAHHRPEEFGDYFISGEHGQAQLIKPEGLGVNILAVVQRVEGDLGQRGGRCSRGLDEQKECDFVGRCNPLFHIFNWSQLGGLGRVPSTRGI